MSKRIGRKEREVADKEAIMKTYISRLNNITFREAYNESYEVSNDWMEYKEGGVSTNWWPFAIRDNNGERRSAFEFNLNIAVDYVAGGGKLNNNDLEVMIVLMEENIKLKEIKDLLQKQMTLALENK